MPSVKSYTRLAILFLLIWSTVANNGFAQQKPKKKGQAGGPAPNTKSNTTISQTGNNNRFPSKKNTTTTNKFLGTKDKALIRSKQETTGGFEGNDILKKRQDIAGPYIHHEPGRQSAETDHGKYQKQHEKAMHEVEKPSLGMHSFKGNIIVKKHNSHLYGKHASEIDHTGRSSETVDHTKYQEYRKQAFERKEANMDLIHGQGTTQYGNRASIYDFSLEQRKATRMAKDRERFDYQGNFDITKKETAQREKDKTQANYSGDLNLEARTEMRREKDKEQANYSGDLDLSKREKMRRETDKVQANYSGDISMHDVLKKAREVRKKEKEIANYSGDILVKTLKARDNRIRIKAKKIANWEGDIVIAKKRKGAHPSAAYNGGRVANSYKEKEKYRQKMLKKYGRNPGMETPNYQKKKWTKPTYDKNEGQIWDVEKYKENKSKETSQ